MVKIKEAIVVEGRYDRNTLSQIVDATIFETNGFGIFKNEEQMALLRTVAQKRGLIVLTDSDGAASPFGRIGVLRCCPSRRTAPAPRNPAL